MTPRVWPGEALRWYLTRARHPFKDYIVGHYWGWFCRARVWIRYDGTRALHVRVGDYTQQRIFMDGYYERALIDWLERTLQPDDVFWDVGANIGAVAIVASRLCRQVVAFEPDPRSAPRLARNIRVNGIENVVVTDVALGAENGHASFHQSAPGNTGMSSLIAGRFDAVGTEQVRVRTADDLLRERPDLRPDVIKIDVEGAEALVLRGAAQLLTDAPPRAIVFEAPQDARGALRAPAVADLLTRAGYAIAPLGRSDAIAEDGLSNFVATHAAAASRGLAHAAGSA